MRQRGTAGARGPRRAEEEEEEEEVGSRPQRGSLAEGGAQGRGATVGDGRKVTVE